MRIPSEWVNLPNALSFYRLLAFPVVLGFILADERRLFAVFLCVSLVTDILDGLLARLLKQQTEFGARLDSLADHLTYLLAFLGMARFEWVFIENHAVSFAILLACYVLPQATALIKYGRMTHFHLYSSKIAGYVQGIFVFTYFAFGYWAPYYYFMVGYTCLAETEGLLVIFWLKNPRSNARSLYFILKKNSVKK